MNKTVYKLVSLVSCLCILLGAVGVLPLINASSSGQTESEMERIHNDFSGFLYDSDSQNIGSSSVLISDDNVKDLQHYETKYKKGNYESLADYL